MGIHETRKAEWNRVLAWLMRFQRGTRSPSEIGLGAIHVTVRPRNLVSFYPCLENLSEVEFKRNGVNS